MLYSFTDRDRINSFALGWNFSGDYYTEHRCKFFRRGNAFDSSLLPHYNYVLLNAVTDFMSSSCNQVGKASNIVRIPTVCLNYRHDWILVKRSGPCFC